MSTNKTKQQRLTKKAKADLKKVKAMLNEQIEKFDGTAAEKSRMKNMLTEPGAATLYLREDNGDVSNVSFDEFSANHTIEETLELWESSFNHDVNALGMYFAGFGHLSNRMTEQGLINEDGSITDAGKLLQEQDEDDLNEELFKELESIFENTQNQLTEQEEEEKKPGLLRRAAGAVGKVVSAPFKVLKFFRDKIYGFVEKVVTKSFGLLKAIGQRFDIKILKAFTNGVEALVGRMKAFCGKNKTLSIICGVIKGVLVAYAIKFAVVTLINAFGFSIGAALLANGAGLAGCAAGALSEDQQINEASGELCNAAVKAGKVASDVSMQLVKGAIKMIASSPGSGVDSGMLQDALNFVDKYDAMIDDVYRGDANVADNIDKLAKAAKACTSEGAALVTRAIEFVGKLAQMPGDAFENMGNKLIKLGQAAGKGDTLGNLARVLAFKDKLQGLPAGADEAKNILGRLTQLGKSLGFDNVGKEEWSRLADLSRKAQGGFVGKVAKAAGLEEHSIERFQHLAKING